MDNLMFENLEACRSVMEVPKADLPQPMKIISIVSSSRSGSTVFKELLKRTLDVHWLSGEEEPYYKLLNLGFPTHPSDRFDGSGMLPSEIEMARKLILSELYTRDNSKRLMNRLALQRFGVEERPFINLKDLTTSHFEENEQIPVLLLKTPQNIYRRGMLEWLFPKSRIYYIFLTRNFAASMNGLMDGWYSEDFEARPYRYGGQERWWKFDMPPGWQAFIESSCSERAFFQWASANSFGLSDYPDADMIHFKSVRENPMSTVRRVAKFCEVRVKNSEIKDLKDLPNMSSTKKPARQRWLERADTIMRFADQAESLMKQLGFTMEKDTWD